MDKFSKIVKKKEPKQIEEPIIFEDEHMKIVKYEDWVVVEEPSVVACLPFLIEYNQIILRKEYIPTFKRATGDDYFLTCVAGKIEEGESISESIRRELEEEAGIVLIDSYKFEFNKPLFACKSTTAQFNFCLVPITENEYHEVTPKGDGTKNESISKAVKIDIKYINSLLPSDLITELLLSKLKEYLAGK